MARAIILLLDSFIKPTLSTDNLPQDFRKINSIYKLRNYKEEMLYILLTYIKRCDILDIRGLTELLCRALKG